MATKSSSRRTAQERARQIVAAQRKAQERRRRLAIAGAAVAVVLVALGVLVAVKFLGNGGGSTTPDTTAADPAVITALTTIPPAVFDQVGPGTVDTLPKVISGEPPLKSGDKPLVLYVGAEYCPFCAAERWAVVAALSRFGTFTNLGQTHSASNDVFPNTPTLSFHGMTYTSDHLVFQGVETQTNVLAGNSYTALDSLSAEQDAIARKYNAAPFVDSKSAGSIPFVDLGNIALISGASFSPKLFAGKTAKQISDQLSTPGSTVTQAIVGTANALTTLLCRMTNNQPATVCSSAGATAYKDKLNA